MSAAVEAHRFTPSEVRRAMLAGTVGNVLEWYDFAVYAFLTPTLGPLFFPSDSRGASMLAAFSVFAVGYFMRPVGGVVLGQIGDRHGRRAMLTASIVIMGASSFLIGLLPTSASAGLLAPIGLVVLRMAQGFSVGGEYTGSMTYTAEIAPPHRRGLLSSLATAGALTGLLLGQATDWALSESLTRESVSSWGWRLPFLCGLPMAMLGLWLRSHVPESGEGPVHHSSTLRELWRHWRALVGIIAIVTGANLVFYIANVFLIERLAIKAPELASGYGGANTICFAGEVVCILLGGWLSDLYGRRRISLIATAIMMAMIVPSFALLLEEGVVFEALQSVVPSLRVTPPLALLALMLVGAPLSVLLGVQGAMIVEFTPKALRCRLFGVAYSLAMAFFCSTGPVICGVFVDHWNQPDFPMLYCLAFGLAAMVALWRIAEPHRVGAEV